jgi:hypothetical protein
MSVGAEAETTGPFARPEAGGGLAQDAPDPAGRVLAWLSVLPALLIMAFLLAGFVLLFIGHFTPVLTVVLSVVVAIPLVVLGLRWLPAVTAAPVFAARAPGRDPARALGRSRTPWWAVAGVVAVAIAFGANQAAYHSQFIIVMRDPASYFQFAEWLSHHGSLPIPQDRAAFGHSPGSLLAFNSFAYYQVGNHVVPQFMAGLPMVLAATMWVGGAHAALLAAPALGALGVLAFGGLTARLVGPRWAPLACLALAVAMPQQFTSRSSYSEPLAQILFLGGLCLVVDCIARDRMPGSRIIAAIAGLAMGVTVLVRIDGVSDVLPLVPYCALLLAGRRQQALPLAAGTAVGVVFGLVDGLVFSRPYLATNKASLKLLAVAIVLVVIVTLVALPVLWKRGLPQVKRNWLPNVASILTVLAVLAFAVRNHVQTVRTPAIKATIGAMTAYQRANRLPIDPTRTYAEYSLHWVFWYIGVPAVILGTAGLAILIRRVLRGQAPLWTLPLITFAWTIVTFLYRPSITPDQPWASRRMVPAVLPGVILLAVWACAWLVGWVRGRGQSWDWGSGLTRVSAAGTAVVLGAAILVPTAIPTFGLGIAKGGPVGYRLTADGMALKTTYWGELAAVEDLCAGIPKNATVVFIDTPAADRLTQVVRGMCGVPAGRITPEHKSTGVPQVKQTIRSIEQIGRTPVLLAGTPGELQYYTGGTMKKIMVLHTEIDNSTLLFVPRTTTPYKLRIYRWEPTS